MARRVKPTKRHLEAARLFLAGSKKTRGHWLAACKEAGFERVPDQYSATCQAAMRKAQDAGLLVDDETNAELAKLESMDWEEAAPVARKMLLRIASGFEDADSSQVQALKEIIARAEGRIGQAQTSDRPIGVVVLPALVNDEGEPWMGPDSEEEVYYYDGRSASA